MNMLGNLDRTKLSHSPVDLSLMTRRIASGNAIVFTGAGFSTETKNVLGHPPPLAKQLARELSKLAKLDEVSEELMFASEVALEFNDHNNILELLKDNYTLRSVSSFHESICKVPWKRFYTTNYDNSIVFECF